MLYQVERRTQTTSKEDASSSSSTTLSVREALARCASSNPLSGFGSVRGFYRAGNTEAPVPRAWLGSLFDSEVRPLASAFQQRGGMHVEGLLPSNGGPEPIPDGSWVVIHGYLGCSDLSMVRNWSVPSVRVVSWSVDHQHDGGEE